ncbi:MAG: hypothetical protein ACRDM9_14915, partial [Gaiellaceae bacterium]
KELGKRWLPPREFGTRLHARVAEAFGSEKLPKGWRIAVEEPLGNVGGAGRQTVRQWLRKRGDLNQLLDELPPKVLDQRISGLTPDVVLEAPNGSKLVWDLTSKSQSEHLAKTRLYTEALAEEGVAIRVAETYWGAFRAK